MRRRRAHPLLILIFCAGLTGATRAPADAFILSEDPLEGRSTELGIILRAFTFAFWGSILEPPLSPVDASVSASSLFDCRLFFVEKLPSLKLVFHNQLTSAVQSHDASGAISFGRGYGPPQWLDLDYELSNGPHVRFANRVDWLYLAHTRGAFTLTIGRQPVTLGRAKIWRPSDLVGAFSLTEVDTEYKPGADAVRLDWTPSSATSVTVLAAAGKLTSSMDSESRHLVTTLARVRLGLSRGEISALGGYVRGDGVAGIDIAYDLGSFDAYGEATLTYVTSRSLLSPGIEEGAVVPKAILGATFHPHSKITLSPELMYNGFGVSSADDYLAVAASDRVAIGEQITMGRLYAGGIGSFQIHELLTLDALVLANLTDPSALASLNLKYNLSGSVDAQMGMYIPVGQLPSEPTAGFPVPRSEYGLYPYFTFFELKAVL